MAIFLLVLKIIGISLLSVIGLIILVLCIPLFVYIKYDEEPVVDIRVLFVRFRVYPEEKDESEGKESFFKKLWKKITDKPSKEETEDESESESDGKSKFKELFSERGTSGAINFLWEILKLACGRFAKIMRSIVVSRFNMKLEIVGDDASDAALRYGKLCGVVYPSLSLIFQNVRKYKHEIDMRPVFEGDYEYDRLSLDIKLRVYPIVAAFHAAALLLGILASEIRRQIAENKSQINVNSN